MIIGERLSRSTKAGGDSRWAAVGGGGSRRFGEFLTIFEFGEFFNDFLAIVYISDVLVTLGSH